jgi:hypothetical protein
MPTFCHRRILLDAQLVMEIHLNQSLIHILFGLEHMVKEMTKKQAVTIKSSVNKGSWNIQDINILVGEHLTVEEK